MTLGTEGIEIQSIANGQERFFAGTAAACLRQLDQIRPQIASI